MKKRRIDARWTAALLVPALLLGGCLGSSQRAKFYTLSTLPGEASASAGHPAGPGRTVGLGPILLPLYLDRPQIVTRVSPTEVEISEFHRWAAPVEGHVRDVLREDLAALLPGDRVVAYPWKGDTPVDCQVEISILRFDGTPGGSVSLVAEWRICGPEDDRAWIARTSSFREPSGGEDYESLVEAKSRALADLGREIAGAIRALPANPPPP